MDLFVKCPLKLHIDIDIVAKHIVILISNETFCCLRILTMYISEITQSA